MLVYYCYEREIAENVFSLYILCRKDVEALPSFLTNLGISYSLNSKTKLSGPDTLLFNNIEKNIQSGIKHTIPISTSFNILKHLNISPSINYTERWYFEKNKNLVYLGYGYEFQEVNYLPSKHFDIRCNAIITNKSIKVFEL